MADTMRHLGVTCSADGSEVAVFGDAGNDVELFGMKRSKAGTELEPLGIGCVRGRGRFVSHPPPPSKQKKIKKSPQSAPRGGSTLRWLSFRWTQALPLTDKMLGCSLLFRHR